MAMFVRHLKLTLLRAKEINACTSLFSGKSRTVVTAKASYKNLVYTTSKVEDMGQNPAWEKDGTNVFHFDFKDESECITVELFNRNNDRIGVSELLFSDLGHLLPGNSETRTLPVMVSSHKRFGELVLATEILEQQAMGDRGLLTVEIQKGLIQRITSIFGSITTKISAKVIYKHTTYKSGVLENMGNKFIWHEDNTFTFIINSDLGINDILRLEVYNCQVKVGECKMLMSLFIKQEENLRRVPSELIAHSTDLCLPSRGAVGSIEVAASFTPKPTCRRNSFPQTQHYLPPQNPYSPPPRVTGCIPYPPGYDPLPFDPRSPTREFYPPVARPPHLNPSPSFNPSSSTLPPELYPPAETHDVYNARRITQLHQPVPDQTYSPSAPPEYESVGNPHPRLFSATVLLSQDYQNAHGAPAGSREPEVQYPIPNDEMKKFKQVFH